MDKKTYSTLLLEVGDDGVATLTVNRPDKLNALNNTVLDELEDAVDWIADEEGVRGILICGAGDKAFVAGADIKELAGLDVERGREASRKGQRIFQKIEGLGKPVIAVVEGYALGGGCELAMACHLRIASKKAVFGLPETSLGLLPGYGGTQRLTRLIGRGRAMEMILTANHIKADLALAYGLINRLVSDGSAADEAKDLMGAILSRGPVAVRMVMKAIDAAAGDPEEGYHTEARLFGKLCGTKDFKEGTSAFLEKRKPQFKGN